MTGILAERKMVSVAKSVTDSAMPMNTLPGKNAFKDNARSFSHCKRINRWRNIRFPLALAGRMRTVGCRLPVMSKIRDTKLLEARMISIFKRQHRKGNGKQANSHSQFQCQRDQKQFAHYTALQRLWTHPSELQGRLNSSLATNSQTDYLHWLLLQSNGTTND